MRAIRITSRVLAGIVFLFSGFVKAIDPMGSAYKFQDYFASFGMEWLDPVALPLSIFLSVAELLIGFALFAGLLMRAFAWIYFVFISFFLVLTLYIAIANPVTDCGCFGDALVISNWETFWKNVFLFGLGVFMLLQRKKFSSPIDRYTQLAFVASFFILGMVFSVYCLRNLPLIDFRPYKIGTYIPEQMIIPEGVETDVYETILIYEKDGVKEEFTTQNYPWQDTTWKWVETKTVLVKKGYTPPIHDFVFTDVDGFDITEDILANPGYTFLLVVYDIEKSNPEALVEANKLYNYANINGHSFYMASASLPDKIEEAIADLNLEYPYLIADDITLKTIVRANPGLMLIKDGVIVGKWAGKNFPLVSELEDKNLTAYALGEFRAEKNRFLIYAYIFGFLLLVTGFYIFGTTANLMESRQNLRSI